MSPPDLCQVYSLPRSWPKHVRTSILHVIGLAQLSFAHSRSWAANSINARIRLKAELARARQELDLVREELRIKDARIAKIPPRHRPRYPPVERLAILCLRAARGWSYAQTARTFLIEPQTLSAWMRRLEDQGPHALVQTPEPINKYPEFVSHIVKRLKVLCPMMGRRKLAEVLARAGLHLGASTVKRMLEAKATEPPPDLAVEEDTTAASNPVAARGVHDVWQTDLTLVSTGGGWWVPWCPFALPQRWPFCWWVALVIDHYSRHVLSYAVFTKQPTGPEVHVFLTRTVSLYGTSPRHLVTDKGSQFHKCAAYERWLKRHKVTPRFRSTESINATGIIERYFRTMKSEYLRRIMVPLRRDAFRRRLASYVAWYHEHRPHSGLGGRTPTEVFEGRRPANRRSRYEPRARWPRGAPCAKPQVPARVRPGAKLELVVTFEDQDRRLPVVEIKRAA